MTTSSNTTTYQTATFGAGCFWGVQHILDRIEGVVSTQVGYMGGKTADPTYRKICQGDTGHAEVVQVVFDPKKISYLELLNYFWRLHDPTQLNRQGPDVGTQYRSVIFFHTPEQKILAEKSKAAFNAAGEFDKPAATEISPAATFYTGEEYHQKYFDKNGGPVCHVLRLR